MFSHVTLGSNNLEASRRFYNAIFAAMNVAPVAEDVLKAENARLFYENGGQFLVILSPINGKPATSGNGTTIGLKLASPAAIDAWHKAGVANGGVAVEDPPGIRHKGDRKLYLAYLKDPDGNKLCAFYDMAG